MTEILIEKNKKCKLCGKENTSVLNNNLCLDCIKEKFTKADELIKCGDCSENILDESNNRFNPEKKRICSECEANIERIKVMSTTTIMREFKVRYDSDKIEPQTMRTFGDSDAICAFEDKKTDFYIGV